MKCVIIVTNAVCVGFVNIAENCVCAVIANTASAESTTCTVRPATIVTTATNALIAQVVGMSKTAMRCFLKLGTRKENRMTKVKDHLQAPMLLTSILERTSEIRVIMANGVVVRIAEDDLYRAKRMLRMSGQLKAVDIEEGQALVQFGATEYFLLFEEDEEN